MMIPVAKGKIPFLMALSYMLFTTGFVFAMMLQLAVYNKKTLPLNANVMRSNRGSSLFQTIIISCAFFLPLIINKALTAFFEQDTAGIIMIDVYKRQAITVRGVSWTNWKKLELLAPLKEARRVTYSAWMKQTWKGN